MKRLRRYLLLLLYLSGCLMLPAQAPEGRKVVHIQHADAIRRILQEDKYLNRLTGNVRLMHNGTLMTCDSADVYSNNSFKASGHVVVVKDNTKLYGETLDYDGNTNTAKVRGKIVRLEDEKAVLRTFNLDFNTKENIGYFYGGGTLADTANVLESARGYYYSGLKVARFEEEVEMHNKEYQIRSDSLHYNTDTETSVFLGPTSIWHKEGYLFCENGWYDRPNDYFHFSKKAYVLSEKQEMWADSIFYDRLQGKSDLYGNIQILDTTRSLLAFGNEAHLVDETRDVVLTRLPSAAYYETDEEGKSDTLFIRGDTLHFATVKNPVYYAKDSISTDSTSVITAPVDTTTVQNDTIKFIERKIFPLPLPLANAAAIPAPFPLPKKNPAIVASDTLPTPITDSLLQSAPSDTLATIPAADSLQLQAVNDTTATIDSVFQYLHVFRGVKFFRNDGQGACDSLVYHVNDTLAEMYYNPVLWSSKNQITSDKIIFIGKNGQMDRIDFLDNAFAISQSDSTHFDQVKGRNMHALFRDNEVYLIDVLNNVQTIFYMVEDSVITDINLGESSNMQINVHERKMTRIKYIENQKISIHPLDQVTKAQERLKGFNWREDDRPKDRYDVCERTVIPSRRTEAASLPLPEFPITKKIDAVKL